MLNLNPDTVCFLIARARVFQSREEVVLPDLTDSPADDWGRQVLADHGGDAVFQEFKSTIEDLEPDQQVELVALMWLGRGDFDLAEWEDALAEAERRLEEARPAPEERVGSDMAFDLYPFTSAETEESGWQRRTEEIVVLGALVGLVVIYFANTTN